MKNFSNLEPLMIWSAIESALSCKLTGYISSFTSYINRVYELEKVNSDRIIVKFYRPGRWTYESICDEHDFLFDCQDAELPVITPLLLSDGGSIGEVDGIYFAVYNKMSGRQYEPVTDEDWLKIGRLIGRLHSVGYETEATERVTLLPHLTIKADVETILSLEVIPNDFKAEFIKVTTEIIDKSKSLFTDIELLRVHGDAHQSNFIDRLDGHVHVIDFDDMVMGPAIQDFWLLLGGDEESCRRELNLMIEGYELFRPFNYREIKLIEPLRAMRMIYFTAWCALQRNDLVFKKRFPNWGSKLFWQKELDDLHIQSQIIAK